MMWLNTRLLSLAQFAAIRAVPPRQTILGGRRVLVNVSQLSSKVNEFIREWIWKRRVYWQSGGLYTICEEQQERDSIDKILSRTKEEYEYDLWRQFPISGDELSVDGNFHQRLSTWWLFKKCSFALNTKVWLFFLQSAVTASKAPVRCLSIVKSSQVSQN